MQARLMILPSNDPVAIRLVRVPEELEQHEAFRHVTGLIASVEEQNPDYDWEDIAHLLEDHGFEPGTGAGLSFAAAHRFWRKKRGVVRRVGV